MWALRDISLVNSPFIIGYQSRFSLTIFRFDIWRRARCTRIPPDWPGSTQGGSFPNIPSGFYSGWSWDGNNTRFKRRGGFLLHRFRQVSKRLMHKGIPGMAPIFTATSFTICSTGTIRTTIWSPPVVVEPWWLKNVKAERRCRSP